jgi:hypothetical protein
VKKELDEALVRDFPNLYRARDGSLGRHSISFGFETTPDAWEPLVRRLAEKLETLILQLSEEERPKYYCLQCKSKLAGLRHYMSAQTPEMTAAIAQAEEESVRTCENCGKPGEVREHNHWLRVECDRCLILK